MSRLDTNNFEILAKHFNDCGSFQRRLKNCISITDVAVLIHDYEESIVSQLKEPVREYVKKDIDMDAVVEYLEDHHITESDRKLVMNSIYTDDFFECDYRQFTKNSMINEMKAELFFEMIDDVSLGDLEALFNNVRPGKVPVNQLSIAV